MKKVITLIFVISIFLLSAQVTDELLGKQPVAPPNRDTGQSSMQTLTTRTITTFPWTEDFSSWPLSDWTITGDYDWDEDSSGGIAYANFWGWSEGYFSDMTSTDIILGTYSTLDFDWSHHYHSSYPNDRLDVQVSTDMSNWTTVWTRTGTAFESNDGAGNTSPGSFTTANVDLSAYDNQTIYVRFHAYSGYGPDLYLDNISFNSSVSSVSVPTGFTASYLNPYDTELTWSNNANNDDVLVAWSTSSTFGTPVDGTTYSEGDVLTGGGEVLYFGNNEAVNFTMLGNETIYFQAWSYGDNNGNMEYSFDVATNFVSDSFCDAGIADISNGHYMGISQVSFNGISNSTGSTESDSYTNYSRQFSTTVEKGQTYSISINGWGYNQGFEVWCDWDQSGTFDSTERNALGSGAVINVTDNITVPSTANTGIVMMRVRSNYSSYSGTPCGTTSYGEVEDYALEVFVPITPEAPTNLYPADYAADVDVNGTLTWDFGDRTETYDLWFGPQGNMVQAVTGATAGTSGSYSYTNLNFTTDYEWQIVLHNTQTTATTSSPVYTFTTTTNYPSVPANPVPADMAQYQPIDLTLTWDFGSLSETYDLWFGSSGNMTEVVTGATVGTTGSYQLTGLSGDTEYQWQVVSHNAYSRMTTQGPVWTFRTRQATAIAAPYTESFDSNTLPTGWVQSTNDDDDWTVQYGSTSSTGTGPSGDHTGSGYYIYTEASGSVYYKDFIISTPVIDLSPTSAPMLKFWNHMYGTYMGILRVSIYDVTTGTEDSNIWSVSGNQGSSWIQRTVDLSAWDGHEVIITFWATTGSSYESDICIDDITINGVTPDATFEDSPADGETAVAVSGDLSWYQADYAAGYKLYLGTDYPPTDIVNGQDLGDVLTYAYSGLRANTVHYWKIVPYNNNGEPASVPVWSFTTDYGPVTTFPWTEDFDGGGLPTAFVQPTDDDANWSFGTYTSSTDTGPQSGDHTSGNGYFAYTEASGNNYMAFHMITPTLDISALNNPGFEFWYHMYGYEMGTLNLDVYNVDTDTWDNDIMAQLSGDYGDIWLPMSVDLTPWQGYRIKVRFRAYTGSGYHSDICIDDIRVRAITPPATTPVSPTIGEADVARTGTLSWNSVNTADGYKLYFGSDSDGTTNPTNIANGIDIGNVTSYNFNRLEHNTTYYWKVVPYNNAGDAENTVVWSFSTLFEQMRYLDFEETFENGLPDYLTTTVPGNGVLEVSDLTASGGSYSLKSGSTDFYGAENQVEIEFEPYTGTGTVQLSFMYKFDAPGAFPMYFNVDVYDGTWHNDYFTRGSGAFDWAEESMALTGFNLNSGYKIRFRIYNNYDTSLSAIYLDDIRVTDTQPEIFVDQTALQFGDIPYGYTTDEQTVTVNAEYLSDQIVITAPQGYEMALSSFAGSPTPETTINIDHDGTGTVTETTVYIRFAPDAAQNFDSTIDFNSTGAFTQSVNVTGNGLAVPALTIDDSQFQNLFPNVNIGNVSDSSIIVVNAQDLTDSLLVTIPDGYEISEQGGIYTTGSFYIAPDANGDISTLLYVRFAPQTASIFAGSVEFSADYVTTENVAVRGRALGAASISLSAIDGDFGDVYVGSESSIRQYTISAVNLTSDVQINIPSGFDLVENAATTALSSTASGYSLYSTVSTGRTNSKTSKNTSSVNHTRVSDGVLVFTPDSLGVLSQKTLDLKFIPTAAQVYAGDIEHTADYAATEIISVTGTGIPVPNIVIPQDLQYFVADVNASTIKSYRLRAYDATGDVNVTTDSNCYLISTDYSTGYTQSIDVTPVNGLVDQTVYVKFTPNVNSTFTAQFVHSTNGAANQTLTVNGYGNADGSPEFTAFYSRMYMITNTSFILEWAASNNTDNTNYEVKISTEPDFNTTEQIVNLDGTFNQYEFTGLSNPFYYAMIVATNASGTSYSDAVKVYLNENADNSAGEIIPAFEATAGDTAATVVVSSFSANPMGIRMAVMENQKHMDIPDGYEQYVVNRVLSVMPVQNNGSLFTTFNYYYSDAEVGNLDETNLRLYRYQNGAWYKVANSLITCYPDENRVSAIATTTYSDWILYDETNGEMPTITKIYSKMNVYLQGPYDSSTQMMDTALNQYLPLTSPYDTESVDEMPQDVVDWIYVELRSTASGSTITGKSMLLHSDGTVTASDGDTPWFNINAGAYFVVIKHRNHLNIMSRTSHTFYTDAYTQSTIDLTTSNMTYTTGTSNLGVCQVETGVFGMAAGDIVDDGSIVSSDNTEWKIAFSAGVSDGYNIQDINFDGSVLSSDNTLWAANFQAGQADSQVPDNSTTAASTFSKKETLRSRRVIESQKQIKKLSK